MSKPQASPIAKALPYKTPPSRPGKASPLRPPPKPRPKGIWIAGGLFLGGIAAYGAVLCATLVLEPDYLLPEKDADLSSRYDGRAEHFDEGLSIFEETFSVNARQAISGAGKGSCFQS
ncbi:hypothetical protein ABVK25_005400 [Lepraria finkii]|uniref:Uncharacterized protein n=1 Tax=Lepraria finkii TaxID=1340010 RepID=A0ABR4BBS9_9LECA